MPKISYHFHSGKINLHRRINETVRRIKKKHNRPVCSHSLTPIDNTVELFFYEDGILQTSTYKWTSLVYKGINAFKIAITNKNNPSINRRQQRKISFIAQFFTNISLFKRISEKVNRKYSKILAGTKIYRSSRMKRGLINELL